MKQILVKKSGNIRFTRCVNNSGGFILIMLQSTSIGYLGHLGMTHIAGRFTTIGVLLVRTIL
jgi:hypothetical protein